MPTNPAPASTIPTPKISPLLVGRHDAARMLAVSLRTLDRLRSAGKLPPSIWIGGKEVGRVSDLAEYVAAGCEIDRWRAAQGASR